MGTELIGRMEPEMLARYRMLEARVAAVHANPRAFSQQETVSIFLDQYRMHGEIIEHFDMEAQRSWSASTADGAIVYGRWEE